MDSKQIPPRPTITDEMVIEAARDEYPEEGLAEDIAKQYERHMDGYELAKALDRWEYWDSNRDDVDRLDSVVMQVERRLREAEAAWAKAYDIQPPYPVGTKVKVPRHGIGEITGVASKHSPACYLIKPEGQDDATTGERRYIIKFEEVELAG